MLRSNLQRTVRNILVVPPRESIASLSTIAFSSSSRPSHVPRQLIPTGTSETINIPISLSDIHLRDEQLPFGYFFNQRLDADELKQSLQRTLARFPIVGGRLHSNKQSIECRVDDTVPLSFCHSTETLDEWRARHTGHDHGEVAAHHPVLMPLFDPLFVGPSNNVNAHAEHEQYENLVSIRITYFSDATTAIGVNFNHMLADTASCLRFVHCWGQEMQYRTFTQACWIRANATVSGMMTEELADIMFPPAPWPFQSFKYFTPWLLLDKYFSKEVSTDLMAIDQRDALDFPLQEKGTSHEYVQLFFCPSTLSAMKAHGMKRTKHFVSTNDMVTAFGWMLKRTLSGQDSCNLSMVVNLRGRCGIEDFDTAGLFGNGITNVIASLSRSTTFLPQDICLAAQAIRTALTADIAEMPDRLALSKMGRAAVGASSSASLCLQSLFSTTSWSQFPLYQSIQFSANSKLVGFHGHPMHPLPMGRTFSSVIIPNADGGVTYTLLLPSDQLVQAQVLHKEMCELFQHLDHDNQESESSTEFFACN